MLDFFSKYEVFQSNLKLNNLDPNQSRIHLYSNCLQTNINRLQKSPLSMEKLAPFIVTAAADDLLCNYGVIIGELRLGMSCA